MTHVGPKWNPLWWFGNADEPVPPAWYEPDSRWRRLKWHLRNPLHNFTFYVVGLADKDFLRTGRYPNLIFNPDEGWNWAVCRYRWLRLPFLSYKRGSFAFYVGWRERCNFGMKCSYGWWLALCAGVFLWLMKRRRGQARRRQMTEGAAGLASEGREKHVGLPQAASQKTPTKTAAREQLPISS